MAVPNLLGLLVLSGIVVTETTRYFSEPDWKQPDLIHAHTTELPVCRPCPLARHDTPGADTAERRPRLWPERR
ncbi:hypothetical protein [Pseudonocardia sp. DLS-67]